MIFLPTAFRFRDSRRNHALLSEQNIARLIRAAALFGSWLSCRYEELLIQRLFENFPDAVWAELKLWARSQANVPEIPTITECVAQVERVAKHLTGVPNALRPDVVAFYAAETADMIARFRATTVLPVTNGEAQAELA